MDDKHKPALWSWEYSDVHCERPIAISSPSGDILVASDDGDGPRAYVSEANARLIAASPDLLAALEAIATFEPTATSDLSAYIQIATHAKQTARAAIAKATQA